MTSSHSMLGLSAILLNSAAIACSACMLTAFVLFVGAGTYPSSYNRSFNIKAQTIMCINVLLMAVVTFSYGFIGTISFVITYTILTLISPLIFWQDVFCVLFVGTLPIFCELIVITAMRLVNFPA